MLRKLQLRRLRVVHLAKVLIVGRVVRACHTDVVASEVCVHPTLLKVRALRHVENKPIAANVNQVVRVGLAVVLAQLLEGERRLAVVFLDRLSFLSLLTPAYDPSQVEHAGYKNNADNNVAEIKLFSNLIVLSGESFGRVLRISHWIESSMLLEK